MVVVEEVLVSLIQEAILHGIDVRGGIERRNRSGARGIR